MESYTKRGHFSGIFWSTDASMIVFASRSIDPLLLTTFFNDSDGRDDDEENEDEELR